MKRLGGLLALAAGALPLNAAMPPNQPTCPPSTVRARIVLLVDLTADRTLCQREADSPFLPASMTKAMTGLIAFDLIRAGKLREDAVVTVRPEIAARWAGKGTTLNLRAGERVTIGQLLAGTLTVSANDAAEALGENALGSTDAFVAAMNARARTIGMAGSHFGTPNGFPDGGRTVVTARDMIRLAEVLITEHPVLYHRYIGKRSMHWRGQTLFSHDPFADVLPGADGIKTGHTFEAGFNFLGAVERQQRRLVLVVGGARTETDRANAARDLAEWGYAAWDSRPWLSSGTIVGAARVQQGNVREVAVAVSRDISWTYARGTASRPRGEIRYDGPLLAPLAKGQRIGWLHVMADDGADYEVPLITKRAVEKAGTIDRLVNGLLGLLP